MHLPSKPLSGFFAPWRGMRLLAAHPKLWPAAIAPFLINLALFIAFSWLTLTYFDSWVRGLIPAGEGWWWRLLLYFALALAVILILVLEIYVFAVVGRIIAAPFLEALTRRTERLVLGREPDFNEPGLMQSILRVAVQELKKLALFLAVMAVLLVINLIPGLGSMLYTIIGGAATCFFLATEFLDYPLERRSLSLSEKLGYVWRLRLTGLSFGASVACLGVIPVLNLAFLPLAAMGGTMLYLERPLAVPQSQTPPPPPPPSGSQRPS